MIAIDTNVLVRVLVEDDEKQAAVARGLVDRALADGACLFVPTIALCETIWVLESVYRFPHVMIVETIRFLLAADQLAIENRDETKRALEVYAGGDGDIADLLIRERAHAHGAHAVATFDRALHRLDGFVSPDPSTWDDDLSLQEPRPEYRRRRARRARLPIP